MKTYSKIAPLFPEYASYLTQKRCVGKIVKADQSGELAVTFLRDAMKNEAWSEKNGDVIKLVSALFHELNRAVKDKYILKESDKNDNAKKRTIKENGLKITDAVEAVFARLVPIYNDGPKKTEKVTSLPEHQDSSVESTTKNKASAEITPDYEEPVLAVSSSK